MLFSLHDWETLCLLALLALSFNLLLGAALGTSFAQLTHGFAEIWAHFAGSAGKKLNRSHRDTTTRRRRGALVALFASLLLLGLGSFLSVIFIFPGGVYLEFCILILCLSPGQTLAQSRAVLRLIASRGRKPVAASLLPESLMRREQIEYDSHTVLRATVEQLALQLNTGLVGPLLYYLVIGWPGLLLLLGIRKLDSLQGYRNALWAAYGAPIALLHSWLQYLPARMTALLICMTAPFAPRGRPVNALRIMLTQNGKLRSRNNGWPVSAMAGLLGVSLGGPRKLHGHVIEDGWVGGGTTRLKPSHLLHARWAFTIATLLCLLALLLLLGQDSFNWLNRLSGTIQGLVSAL